MNWEIKNEEIKLDEDGERFVESEHLYSIELVNDEKLIIIDDKTNIWEVSKEQISYVISQIPLHALGYALNLILFHDGKKESAFSFPPTVSANFNKILFITHINSIDVFNNLLFLYSHPIPLN